LILAVFTALYGPNDLTLLRLIASNDVFRDSITQTHFMGQALSVALQDGAVSPTVAAGRPALCMMVEGQKPCLAGLGTNPYHAQFSFGIVGPGNSGSRQHATEDHHLLAKAREAEVRLKFGWGVKYPNNAAPITPDLHSPAASDLCSSVVDVTRTNSSRSWGDVFRSEATTSGGSDAASPTSSHSLSHGVRYVAVRPLVDGEVSLADRQLRRLFLTKDWAVNDA